MIIINKWICSIVNLILLYSGSTGFILAARNGHLNILEFLLTVGSTVDEKNDNGKIKLLLFIYVWSLSDSD